jgi:hypothetical protein
MYIQSGKYITCGGSISPLSEPAMTPTKGDIY